VLSVANRDYHYLSQIEIGGAKRISQHLSRSRRPATDFLARRYFVKLRRTHDHARINFRLSTGDEHLAIGQSCSRVKESRGPQTARRRERVRRGIEDIDSRKGAAGGGKRESFDHEHGAVPIAVGTVADYATRKEFASSFLCLL